jgi:hypothetical protein
MLSRIICLANKYTSLFKQTSYEGKRGQFALSGVEGESFFLALYIYAMCRLLKMIREEQKKK